MFKLSELFTEESYNNLSNFKKKENFLYTESIYYNNEKVISKDARPTIKTNKYYNKFKYKRY